MVQKKQDRAMGIDEGARVGPWALIRPRRREQGLWRICWASRSHPEGQPLHRKTISRHCLNGEHDAILTASVLTHQLLSQPR